MAYSATVPADNLYIKDIPAAIREKGKELAAITEGYPPVVNADTVDGYDTSLTPAANVILVTDEDGKLPASSVDFGANVLAGSGLEIAEEDPAVESVTIAMQTPLTCTLETENAFPEGGGHTHKLEIGFSGEAFAFYENFTGYTMAAANTSTYTLVKTFTIAIPNPGVYMFDCAYKVTSWGEVGLASNNRVKMDLAGGTMVFGQDGATYSEEVVASTWIIGYTEENNPIYAYEVDNVIKNPLLSGRMVYFADAGNKTLKVYMMGNQGFQISNFCLGVIGAGTAA